MGGVGGRLAMMNLGEVGSVAERRDVSQFGRDEYWRQRYEGGSQTFEWFVSLEECLLQAPMVRGLLESRVRMQARVLEIGCGTSSVAEQLWDMGFRHVTAIDNQPKAIAFCQERQKQKDRQIDYQVGDMTKLDGFADKSLDLIVDKGALDALVCRGDDSIELCAAQLWRVLKAAETSVLIVLSNSPLDEIVSGLKRYFKKEEMIMIRNEAVGQLMAKCYLFSRRKSKM